MPRRWKSSCLDITRTINKIWLYKLNLVCETFSYQVINYILSVNQAVFCYYQMFAKIIMKEKTLVLVVVNNTELHYSNSCKTDLAKLIWVDFGKSEFLNIHIFNWYKTLYLARRNIFRHLDFIRAIQMISSSFQQKAFLKASSYDFINTWNTEFYIPLSLGQNKSRYKIWH